VVASSPLGGFSLSNALALGFFSDMVAAIPHVFKLDFVLAGAFFFCGFKCSVIPRWLFRESSSVVSDLFSSFLPPF